MSAAKRRLPASGVPERRRVRTVHRRLAEAFGPLEPPRRTDPLDELILTVLSQHTSDANSLRAFSRLRERFPTWERVVRARDASVADAIRSGGLANTKAPRVKAILREIRAREGSYDLSWMRTRSDEQVREYLLSLPGVGPKTAACVLAFSLGRNALPVDTHVRRVAGRLGVVPPGTSAERAQTILEALVPPPLRLELHVGLIRLGREICKALRPRCEECPLADVCPTAPSVLGGSVRPARAPAGRTRGRGSTARRANRAPSG